MLLGRGLGGITGALALTLARNTRVAASPGKRIQTFIDLIGTDPRGALHLDGLPDALIGWAGITYAWPASALSASARLMRFEYGLAPVYSAQWKVVWNPLNTHTGIRLITTDAGLTNPTELGKFEGSSYVTPTVNSVDVTDAFNALVAGGNVKLLSHQQKGDGATGAIIFQSALEIVWDLS